MPLLRPNLSTPEPPVRIECRGPAGHVVAVATEDHGRFVVMGCMAAWREAAAALLPFIREAAAGFDSLASDF